LVAELEPGVALLDGLAIRGAPAALTRAARDVMESQVPGVLGKIAAADWRWITPADEDYPYRLTQIADPPLGLFVRGHLRTGPSVTVVGSRRATAYGRQVARLLAEEFAKASVLVVSGMARGVDAAAHEGALAASGETWAVWGAGPDRIYPPEHARLAEQVARHGALLTEYPPGTPPRRHHFPERNRLLAGIADAVVVVEAAARSGALVTARQAVDEGREVFAVPGSILSDLSVGPNALLRMGAQPLLHPNDVLRSLNISPAVNVECSAAVDNQLLDLMAPGEALSVDDVASRAGRPVPEVLEQILSLEIEGHIERQQDGRYSRVRGIDAADT
jgi:DNA processing protein